MAHEQNSSSLIICCPLRKSWDDKSSIKKYIAALTNPNSSPRSAPSVGYAWGMREDLHYRGEARLLQAAQIRRADSFVPARHSELPTTVPDLMAQAEACLQATISR